MAAAIPTHAISGHNYVKLRDIGKAVAFGVSYDPLTNSVIVVSGSPYQEETPPETPTAAAKLFLQQRCVLRVWAFDLCWME